MTRRTKVRGQRTWRKVEEYELSQAILKFMQIQRDLKCMLGILEPKRVHGSPFSQPKRKRSIIGAPAYWNDPAKGQAELLAALDKRAQEIESKNTARTGHCVNQTVQHKEKSK